MMETNGKKKRDQRVGFQVPSSLAKHLEELAAAESLSRGERVTVSSLCRRAIMERYKYGSWKVKVDPVSEIERTATYGLITLAR